MNKLIWDFDGVIVDSLVQRAIVAHLTYKAYKQGVTEVWDVDKAEIDIESDSDLVDTLDILRDKRTFLVPEEGGSRNYLEQLILLRDEGVDFDSTEEFLEQRELYSSLKDAAEYRNLFLSLEQKLAEKFGDRWTTLAPLYEGIKEIFLEMRQKFEYYICSQSENRRIARILEYNGIDFDPSHIFGLDYDRTEKIPIREKCPKIDRIRRIKSQAQSEESRIIIIEDDFAQACSVNKVFPEMGVYLAMWGYVAKNWQELIKNTGISPVYLDNLMTKLQDASKRD